MLPLPADNMRLVSLGFAGLLLVLLVIVLVLLAKSIRQVRAASAIVDDHVPEPDDADLTKLRAFSVDLLPKLSLDDPDEDGDGDGGGTTEDSVPELRFEGDAQTGVDETTGAHDLISTNAAGQTDRGLKRRRNEDACLVDPDLDLYVVADGMGGYAGGDVASATTVKEVREVIRKAVDSKGAPLADGGWPRRGKELADAIERANGLIYNLAVKKNELAGMGTTAVAARFLRRRQRVYIAHVGDSRTYRFRAGALKLLTVDHTLGAKGVTGPLAGNVRRAVGVSPSVKVDLLVDKPLPDDLYLLCSDGMYKMLDDVNVVRILSQERDPQRAVAALVAAANEAGGKDNISVVVISIAPAGAAHQAEARQAQARA